jgi:antitoxin component of MazEF toxin-antitoxin module
MDEVHAKRFVVVTTKHGKPIAKMISPETSDSADLAEMTNRFTPENIHPETDWGYAPKISKKRVGGVRPRKHS